MLLAITGGPATGKSTLTRFLRREWDAAWFSADECVHRLLREDRELQGRILTEVASEAGDGAGGIDRAKLRKRVLEDGEARRKLEGLIHPLVRKEWMALREECRRAGRNFGAEIPLLYETGGEKEFDRVVVVACSREVQERRLRERGLDLDEVKRLIEAQLPLEEKIARADHVAWNDGTEAALEEQGRMLLKNL